MSVRGSPLLWAAPLLFVVMGLSELGVSGMAGAFRTGVIVGIALVVLVLYPVFLHHHERRIAELERRLPAPRGDERA